MDLTTSQPALPTDEEQLGHGEEKKEDPQKKLKRDIEKHFLGQIESSDRTRRDYIQTWKRNIELRRGKPNSSYSAVVLGLEGDDDYQSEVNPDWYLTKSKTAALWSQMPDVRLMSANPQFVPAVAPFAKSLNYELTDKRCSTNAAMVEVVNDIVNASGIGAIRVGYAARFEDKEVPAIDTKLMPPEIVQQMIATKTMPMKTVPEVVDYRFFTNRISSGDLLWPGLFTGSDWDQSPWVGEKFKTSRAEAKVEFHLEEEELDKLSADESQTEETLRMNRESGAVSEMKTVRGKRIFYWRYRVDPECKSFSEIWEIVWLEGIENPVYHDQWQGQRFVPETKKYVGACKFPIQIGAITYISDNPVPPSDTEAGRPQVNDMRRSRRQMFQNRAYSFPMRWFNTDLTDPAFHDLLMKGQYQGAIPVQGQGDHVMGEVARASYPAEDLTFDKVVKDDLMLQWGMGPNQLGMLASHETTKGEAEIAQGGYTSVISQERSAVVKLFLGVVEVLAGLMALYSDFPNLSQPERAIMMQAWDNKHILHDLAFTILPDAQIAVDTNTQIRRISQYMNLTVKSGFINVKALIMKLTLLHGLDPAEVTQDPVPHPMKPAGVSFSFKGKDDLMNPMVVAILAKNQQLPTPEDVDMATMYLVSLQQQVPLSIGVRKQQQMLQAAAGGQPGQPGPQGPPRPTLVPRPMPPNQDHQPQWGLANKVAKRSRDLGGGA